MDNFSLKYYSSLNFVLDKALGDYLKDSKFESQDDYNVILNEELRKFLNEAEIKLIFGYLVNKGYLSDCRGRTYNGIIFQAQGGFAYQRSQYLTEKSRLDNVEKIQMDNEKRIVSLTRWLTFASLGLLLFEIVKYIKQYHPRFFEFGLW